MKVHFYKYQATGNDFILIDNRDGRIAFTVDQIEKICDRRFGVGADGLIQIEKDPTHDFKMVYYNRDGSQSLCGNGTRAAVKMASSLGLVNGKAEFSAYDGVHSAALLKNGSIRVRMNDVREWKDLKGDIFMNTGSPHYIRYVRNLKDFPVVEEGRAIRYSDDFKPGGTNVNFVELLGNNTLFIRTYERGVENETLSCGTGVTAAALAASFKGYTSPVDVQVMGGRLSVEFKFSQSGLLSGQGAPSVGQAGIFEEIFLTGPAKMVFEGDLEL
jgi:diaminopimelate epimerase